jgi:hypothetical protein
VTGRSRRTGSYTVREPWGSGYEETPAAISTPASGEFKARIRANGTELEYELTYRDTESAVTQAHIHFGRPATSGGIVLFLCTNLTPPVGVPAPQACPAAPATISGTLTAADVIVQAAQGIEPRGQGRAPALAISLTRALASPVPA